MRSSAVKRGGGGPRAAEHRQVVTHVTASRPRQSVLLGNIAVEISMHSALQKAGILGLVGAAAIAVVACSPPAAHRVSAEDLMEDRVMLDGVLLKCDQDSGKARSDADCENARIAVERLASQQERADETKRREEFEHSREQLRLAQEKPKLDGYSLPVVPVDPPPAGSTDDQKPSVTGQPKP
jgi:hypothetical protein